nr:MAG TPA: hypothetical protein [Caudoviricetes sp.]
MVLLYSVLIRACNRYHYRSSYITICAYRSFYGLFIRSVHNGQVLRLMYRIHIRTYIILY